MHIMILGQTTSGKTTLAKHMAKSFRAQGLGVIVHDPVNDPEWECDSRETNFSAFISRYWASRGCVAFFDEAGETASEHLQEMTKTATRGRHWGHKNIYIAQRGALIPRTLRDQCSELFLFGSGLEDCKIHAAEWNAPVLRENGPKLARGEFYHVARMGSISRFSLEATLNNPKGKNDESTTNRRHGVNGARISKKRARQ